MITLLIKVVFEDHCTVIEVCMILPKKLSYCEVSSKQIKYLIFENNKLSIFGRSL
jgi:hypothetical protein